ncbi:hypothetical protein [Desulfosediminicola flagellatus]|uniref:hypothetical protein n=1 Tax=Desulfosediminicola flagellatus TaxID=2569541 RepID=UPI0010AD6E46|nr:hypothetical protein [Desulfosediminicola flagellatus]
MSVYSDNSVFTSLLQHGPLAVEDCVNLSEPFSKRTREWVKRLSKTPNNVTKYRALRSQIFEFLEISSFEEIQEIIENDELRDQISKRAYARLANMFGIQGNTREIESRVHEYARTADAVVNSLKNKIFKPYTSHIATTNEIEVANDPIQLLLIIFDDRYHKKARFEARRKLQLMNLAASIHQREGETEIEVKFSNFLKFLNDFVWSRKQKIGEHDIVYLLSEHNEDDFSCKSVKVIDRAKAASIKTSKGTKLTLLKRRKFQVGEREYPIYVSIRKKPPEAKVLKLLRKNEKNPAIAVDDELGLMAVLDTVSDVKIFQNHLTRSASRADSFMVLEDISDTLTGTGEYSSSATGSSKKTPMLKFFARLGGMRVEFIIHTNRSWLNYMYQQDVAHDEYEVRRIFDSGVADLLFPAEIFQLDHTTIRIDMLKLFREQIEKI